MGDNSSAIKTIAILVLLLIVLAIAAIFSYNPVPEFNIGGGVASPSATQVPTCESEDPESVNTCCQEWASNNQVTVVECVGSWSWTQLGGCTFSCSTEM